MPRLHDWAGHQTGVSIQQRRAGLKEYQQRRLARPKTQDFFWREPQASKNIIPTSFPQYTPGGLGSAEAPVPAAA
jgi:hypothetical protein